MWSTSHSESFSTPCLRDEMGSKIQLEMQCMTYYWCKWNEYLKIRGPERKSRLFNIQFLKVMCLKIICILEGPLKGSFYSFVPCVTILKCKESCSLHPGFSQRHLASVETQKNTGKMIIIIFHLVPLVLSVMTCYSEGRASGNLRSLRFFMLKYLQECLWMLEKIYILKGNFWIWKIISTFCVLKYFKLKYANIILLLIQKSIFIHNQYRDVFLIECTIILYIQ